MELRLYLLFVTIKFCYGQNEDRDNCQKHDDELMGVDNGKPKLAVISSSSDMPVPKITEINDQITYLEERDSIEINDTSVYKEPLTTVLFFSVGADAKVVVKKSPGSILYCEVHRRNGNGQDQVFVWIPRKSCSFTIANFSSNYFGEWSIHVIKVNYESKEKNQRQIMYLVDAAKNKFPKSNIQDIQSLQVYRTIYGIKKKMYRRLGTDRLIAMRPSTPSKGSVQKCQAIRYSSSGQTTYNLAPRTDASADLLNYTGRYYNCEFEIIVLGSGLLGKWEIITYYFYKYENNLTKLIDYIEIYEIPHNDKFPTAVPNSSPGIIYFARAGNFISMNYLNKKFPEEKIKSCKLINKRMDKQHDLYTLTETDRDIKLIGKCGVQMRVFKNNYIDHIDHWLLEASHSSGDVTYEFKIIVINYRYNELINYKIMPTTEGLNKLTTDNEAVIHDKSAGIGGVCFQNIQDCELEFPNGTLVSMMQSNCTYTFTGITLSDSGRLRLYYRLKNKIHLKEYTYEIEVEDVNNIMVHKVDAVMPSSNNISDLYIFLIVRVFSRESKANKCQLTSLKNHSISFDGHMGRNERSDKGVYGSLIDYHVCFFKIPASSNVDHRVWKFSIVYDSSHSKSRNMILNSHVERNEGRYLINNNYIGALTHVIYKDKFVVNCSQNAPLDYCRFTSPIEVIYPVTNKSLLEAGKCEITIPFADYNHDGVWNCRFGTTENNSTETTTFLFSIQVSIHEPKLSLDVREHYLENRVLANILCEKVEPAYPSNGYFDGCWWGHPSGRNISQNTIDLKIFRDQNLCTISFNRLHEEDFGRWSCFREYVMDDSRVTVSNSTEFIKTNEMTLAQNYSVSCYIKDYGFEKGPSNAIKCQVSPRKNVHISSCHWIRPGNISLFPNSSVTADSKYESLVRPDSLDTCTLRFPTAAAEDMGVWTCHIKVTNSFTDLITGRVQFYQDLEDKIITDKNVFFIVFGGAFLVIIIFLIVIGGIFKLVRRYLDARATRIAERPATETPRAVTSSQSRIPNRFDLRSNPTRLERPTPRRTERRTPRRNLDQSRRPDPEERRQSRTHVNPGPESLTARRTAAPDNVYV